MLTLEVQFSSLCLFGFSSSPSVFSGGFAAASHGLLWPTTEAGVLEMLKGSLASLCWIRPPLALYSATILARTWLLPSCSTIRVLVRLCDGRILMGLCWRPLLICPLPWTEGVGSLRSCRFLRPSISLKSLLRRGDR